MKSKSLFAAVLLGSAVAIGSVGCTHLGDKSAGAIVDDATITTKVKAGFIDDNKVDAASIKVETLNGAVLLSGFAKNGTERGTAESIARGVTGVKSVHNQIAVRP